MKLFPIPNPFPPPVYKAPPPLRLTDSSPGSSEHVYENQN